MTLQDWCSILIALIGVCGIIGSIFVTLSKLFSRIAIIETKIDVYGKDIDNMQIFLLRRGKLEAVQKGFGKFNSAFIFNEETKKCAYELPLATELKKFYHSCDKDLPDEKLAMKIESKFGEQLIKEICIPKNMQLGACLILALDIVKNDRRKINIGYSTERRKV